MNVCVFGFGKNQRLQNIMLKNHAWLNKDLILYSYLYEDLEGWVLSSGFKFMFYKECFSSLLHMSV